MRKFILYLLSLLIIATITYYFFPEKPFPPNSIITKLVVYKSKRQLLVFSGDKLLKTYTISLGHQPIGNKEYEGDNRTPEGYYLINSKNPNSTCYKNLGISYPNEKDLKEANKKGISAGGDIKVHGLKNGQNLIGKFHRFIDWTNGCIGVTNKEMDELYFHVAIGTPIIIYP